MRRAGQGILLAVLLMVTHFVATAALGLWLLQAGMNRFDTSEPPSFAERIGGPVFVINHPAFWTATRLLPPGMPWVVQVAPLALDSVLWGFGIACLIDRLRRAVGRPNPVPRT